MRRPATKLVCTLGPASVGRARELVDAGMSVARVNFSHGTPEEQKEAVHAVRAAAHHARRSVAVLVDLPGPKIRLPDLPGDELELETGATFELHTNRPTLADELRPGDRVLLADGAVELVVMDASGGSQEPMPPPANEATAQHAEAPEPAPPADDDVPVADPVAEAAPAEATLEMVGAETGAGGDDALASEGPRPGGAGAGEGRPVRTRVVRGGLLRSRAGVNVPIDRLASEALTDEDRAALPRALELRADLIAQSFVRSAADLETLRALLPRPGPLLVAKIETRAAVEAFDDILAVADGVMVARGDLGVDMPYEEVPLVQKDLIRRARARGRFTIVATQMLESMTASPRPTRAEASDVANAVIDGTDAVMLSAETAIGRYPVEAARTMAAICQATEAGPDSAAPLAAVEAAVEDDDAAAICRAAVSLAAQQSTVDAIWCFTRTGRTAELLSQLRPRVSILAFTINAVAARRAAVRRGVVPLVMPTDRRTQPLVESMESVARAQGLLASGPSTVVVVTTSTQRSGINRLELHHPG
jgi:pyruvate kinase